MASSGRMVNLGQVGFGLVADTETLRESLEVLKTFGREVDRVGKGASDLSQQMFAAFKPMEAALTRAQVSTEQTIRKLRELGATSTQIDAVQQSLSKFTKEVVENSDRVAELPNRLARGTIGLGAIQNRMIAEAKATFDERNKAQAQAIQLEKDHANALVENEKHNQRAVQTQQKMQDEVQKMGRTQAAAEQEDQKRAQTQARIAEQQQAQVQRLGAVQANAEREEIQRNKRMEAEQLRVLQQNTNMARQVQLLGVRAQASNVDPSFMGSTQQALGAFQATSTADPRARVAALMQLRDAMGLVQQELVKTGGTVNTFATGLRDLERAAILAVGPLSGIGSRLAVLSALFESSSFTTALTIAGVTAVAAAFAFASAEVIKITMEMQRFNALLEASTGSVTLVKEEYAKVAAIADRWGFSIKELVEPYGKFTVAARLSGLAANEQQKAFEAVSISARALNLDANRTGLIFLAMEQMLSKGTVYMEEMRRQLGDLLPGAFAIAARSMGMTQAAFTKAITEGRILATDLIPKLSEALMQVFSPAAERASHNLAGELGRFKTAIFELGNAIESVTHITDIFTRMIVSITEGTKYLSANIRDVLGAFGAIAGAGVGAGLAAILFNANTWTNIAKGVSLVRTEMTLLTGAVVALDVATLASGAGTLLSVLAKLGIVLGTAAAGFYLFKPGEEQATESLDHWAEATQRWIKEQMAVGAVDKQVSDAMRQQARNRMTVVQEEIDKTAAAADLRRMALEKERTHIQNNFRGADAIKQRLLNETEPDNDPEYRKQAVRYAGLVEIRDKIRNIMVDLGDLNVTTPDNSKAPGHAFENWLKKARDELTETQALWSQLKASMKGKDAMEWEAALGQAKKYIQSIPDKDRTLEDLARNMSFLAAAGYEMKGVFSTNIESGPGFQKMLDIYEDQMARMFYAHNRAKQVIADIKKAPQDLKAAFDGIANMDRDLNSRRAAVNTVVTKGDPEDLARERQYQEAISKYQKFLDVMSKMRLSPEQQGILMTPEGQKQLKEQGLTIKEIEDYLEGLRKSGLSAADAFEVFKSKFRETQAMEKWAKDTEKMAQQVATEMERLGSRVEKSQIHLQKQAQLFSEAEGRGIITHEQAMDLMAKANDDAYRTMYGRTTEFGKAMHSAFSNLERDAAKALVDPLVGIKSSWADVFKSLERTVLEFVAKVLLIQPAMKYLFGGLYTNQSADAHTGLLEGSMIGLGGLFGAKLGFQGASLDQYTTNAATIQADIFKSLPVEGALGLATGGSFEVGGSGATDSQPVSFMATPGEKVNVTKGGQNNGDGNVTIIINNQTGTPVAATSKPPRMDGGIMVFELLLKKLNTDAGARRQLQSTLAPPQN